MNSSSFCLGGFRDFSLLKDSRPWNWSQIKPFWGSLGLHLSVALGMIAGSHVGLPERTTLSPVPIELVGALSIDSMHHAGVKSTSQSSGEKAKKKRKSNIKSQGGTLPSPVAHAPAAPVMKESAPAQDLPQSDLPQSGQNTEGSAVAFGSALQLYAASVAQRIDAMKSYPQSALFRGEEGRVVVSIRVLPSGQIHHLAIVEPCFFEALNHAALDTLSQVGQLPPLPQGMDREIEIRIPLDYSLKST